MCTAQPITDTYVNQLRVCIKESREINVINKRAHDFRAKEIERWQGKFAVVCHENNRLRAKLRPKSKGRLLNNSGVTNLRHSVDTISSDMIENHEKEHGVVNGMPIRRWRALMKDDTLLMNGEEIALGWHFCPEWDGLLIGPGMAETDACSCVLNNDSKVSALCPEQSIQ